MKQFLKQTLLVTVLIASILGGVNFASAQGTTTDPLDDFTSTIDKTNLPRFEGRPHGDSSIEPGADIITTVIFQVIDFMKYLLGGIAILFITVSGIKLITAGKTIDEVSEKQKESLKYILFGLMLVIVADSFVKEVLFGDYGECIASSSNAAECAKRGSLHIRGIYNFVEIFVGSIAVLMFVLAGFRLATSAGAEEVIEKQKKRLATALVGIFIIGLSEFVVQDVIFPEAGQTLPNVSRGQFMIFKLINFISSFVGALSVILFIYAGFLYVTAAGGEENTTKAKKILVGAVIGILVAFAAFGTVRTLTRLEGREGEAVENVIDRADESDFDTTNAP
ncbi:MAG: hypothetical protein UY05_C0016G0003 [Candidatus Peregrinibacteria bacterium GW2011_GWA2_47_7]|nr:MAG: hypothetical protein UY05_C0016G0003 [Candidatus Peregrinibacteria bacterium GW2011_GWA2_47_7]